MNPQGMRTLGQKRMAMPYQIRRPSLVFLQFATIFMHLVYFTTAQADSWWSLCVVNGSEYTEDSLYRENLGTVLSNLKDTDNGYGFFNSSAGVDEGEPDAAYAVALCRGDIGPDDCLRCVDDATRSLSRDCGYKREASGWYDKCLLNYSNGTLLYNVDEDISGDVRTFSESQMDDQFVNSMESLFPSIQVEAAKGGPLRKYAVGNTSEPTYGSLYGLMQCTPDLSEDQCNQCLTECFQYCLNNPDSISRAYYRPNCLIRYGVDPFFNDTWYPAPPAPSPRPSPPPPPPVALPVQSPPSLPPPPPESKSLMIGPATAASTIGIHILVFLFMGARVLN